MAIERGSNVEQVSGMTPQGASLAANLADQAGQNSRMAAQMAQQSMVQARQMQHDKELAEFHAQLEKEAQAERLKAEKENLNTEISARREQQIREGSLRKKEQQFVQMQMNLRTELEQAKSQMETELKLGNMDAANETANRVRALQQQFDQGERRLQRIGMATAGFSKAKDAVTKMLLSGDEMSPGMVKKMLTAEAARYDTASRMRLDTATLSYFDELEKSQEAAEKKVEADKGDIYPGFRGGAAEKRILEGRAQAAPPPDPAQGALEQAQTAMATTLIEIAGVNGEQANQVAADLAAVFGGIRSGKSEADMRQEFERLKMVGIDKRTMGYVIGQMEQLLAGGARGPTANPTATKGPNGESLIPENPGGVVDPGKAGRQYTKGLQKFKEAFSNRALLLGITPVTSAQLAEEAMKPTTTMLQKLVEDLADNGVINNDEVRQLMDQVRQASGPEAVRQLRQQALDAAMEAEKNMGTAVTEAEGFLGGEEQDLWDVDAAGRRGFGYQRANQRQLQLAEEGKQRQRDILNMQTTGAADINQRTIDRSRKAADAYNQQVKVVGEKQNQATEQYGMPDEAEQKFLGGDPLGGSPQVLTP
jgi:hypothetical protein